MPVSRTSRSVYILGVLLAIGAPRAGALPAAPAAWSDHVLNRTNGLILLTLGSLALASNGHADSDAMVRLLDRSPLEGGLDLANVYGEGAMLGATAAGFMALGRAAGDPRLASAGRDLSRSLLAAWSLTWILKLAVNERRPNGAPYSFPSGHTATAFAAAPVFSKYFGHRAGYAAYGLAVLTGLARMEDRKHYLWDVLAGAAIGTIAGRIFTQDGPLQVTPLPAGDGVGLGLSVAR